MVRLSTRLLVKLLCFLKNYSVLPKITLCCLKLLCVAYQTKNKILQILHSQPLDVVIQYFALRTLCKQMLINYWPLFPTASYHQREAGVAGGPADMASSIKALALSVQNTGVFGDLPRPRVNSASRYK